MKSMGSFWSGLVIGALAAGAVGYRTGWEAGAAGRSSPPARESGPSADAGGPAAADADENLCAPDQLASAGPGTLLDCLRRRGFADDLGTFTTVLPRYFSLVAAGGARLAELVEALAEEGGSGAPEDLLAYIETEIDPEKIALASETLKQLLRAREGSSGADTGWLIDHLSRLLWLTPDDVSLNLWLAQLFLRQGQIEDVRYHALVAANVPAYAEEAADLLREINGDGDDGSIAIDLEVAGNQYYIAARVNGNPARLLLDTGASISGVSSAFVDRYPAVVGETREIVLSTAAGLKTGRKFTADELSFGELRFSDHEMVIFSDAAFRDFDGVLGVDVLQRADFFIDRKESKLRIFPAGGQLP